MTVRLRLALTVFLAGLAAALGVIVTVALAFQRFENESSYQRADAFIGRVVALHPDLLDQHERAPDELHAFLRSLVLYDPGTRLYLLDPSGQVIAATSQGVTAKQVAMAPVREAVQAAASGDARRAAYVMGEDPEALGQNTVISARPLMRSRIGPTDPVAGYLYLVCRKSGVAGPQLALFGSTLAGPALAAVLAVIVLTTALAAWTIIQVTRPLRVLSDEVALAARQGFSAEPLREAADVATAVQTLGRITDDEFGRLRSGFHTLLARLHLQWDQLRRLDHFRRESVSNLSHDLRSPLTATVACLETLEQRWAASPPRAEDARLVEVALRNTRNAAGMVRALGDLALLDEPQFKLQLTQLDLGEVLDDIALRFAERAAKQGVLLSFEQQGAEPLMAQVDTELFERAIANLLDNALKFSAPGQAVKLSASRQAGPQPTVWVQVQDCGAGISAQDLPRLFDRLYQSHLGRAPVSGEQGKGLGLAIVKRIAELHGGQIRVESKLGAGTMVRLELPASEPPFKPCPPA